VDLNYLYSRHQISLINARAAKCDAARAAHMELARSYAAKIRGARDALGAKAAARTL